jgi:hypothetical protein
MSTPVVVCPLRFEQGELRRHGVGRRATLDCCGLGAAGVREWAGQFTPPSPDDGGAPRVVLAGIAGGLRPHMSTTTAYVASTIVDSTSRRWEPTWPGPTGTATAAILQADAVLTTPQSKRDAAARFGADLVDMESAAFAELAAARGWRWTVVRGVSDDDAAALPADIGDWLHPSGRLRPLRIASTLARRPALLGPALRVRADGKSALRSVAAIVNALLEGTDPPPVP